MDGGVYYNEEVASVKEKNNSLRVPGSVIRKKTVASILKSNKEAPPSSDSEESFHLVHGWYKHDKEPINTSKKSKKLGFAKDPAD